MSTANLAGPVVVVNLTEAPDDLHRAVTALDRRINGVVIIAARPAVGLRRPRVADLSSDLLDALGHIGARADRRRLEADLQRPTAFLATSTVTDLVVTDAGWLLPDGIEEVVLMAGVCAVRLWLLLDHPDTAVIDYLHAAHPLPWTSAAGFEQHWAARLGQPAATPLPVPPWPLIDPAASLHALHQALSDQHPINTLPAADQYCDPVRDSFAAAAGDASAVVALFDAALFRCTCTTAASCLRPLAEHAWHAGYLSLGDWQRWRARRPSAGPEDLNLYRDTARPAATALSRLGLTGVQMTDLLMREVTSDGASINHDNHQWAVPVELRLILRRQHLAGASCGVGPTGPFLTLMGAVLPDASSLVV